MSVCEITCPCPVAPVRGSVAESVTSKGWDEMILSVSLSVTATICVDVADPRGPVTVRVTGYSPGFAKA